MEGRDNSDGDLQIKRKNKGKKGKKKEEEMREDNEGVELIESRLKNNRKPEKEEKDDDKPEGEDNKGDDPAEDEEEMFITSDGLTRHIRSGFVTLEQRKEVEERYMEGLEVKGVLGLKNFQVDKSSVYIAEDGEGLEVSLSKKNRLMKLDGIYLTKADMTVNSLNINRLEQRLIRLGQDHYFRKDNKQLKIDNKIFEEKIYKKIDISLLSNPFFGTQKRSAVICERSNQRKDVYYLIEMKIAKIQIKNHPLFNEEDKLCSQLKEKIAEYNIMVDKAILPHLGELLQTLRVEDDRVSQDPRSSESDIALVRKQIEETKMGIREEQRNMQNCMQDAYDIWRKISSLRTNDQRYASTPFKLTIQEYKTDAQTDEQYFMLRHSEVSMGESFDGRPLPKKEYYRRKKVRNTRFWVEVVINGHVMARTRKVKVDWPSFEVEFQEKFQIFVYTKPYSVKLRVCTGGVFTEVISEIEVDTPGENVETLTSTVSFIRNLEYKKIKQSRRKKGKKANANKKKKNENEGALEIIDAKAEGNDEEEEDDDKVTNRDDKMINGDDLIDQTNDLSQIMLIPVDENEKVIHQGSILLQIGWKGFGPKLPPANSGGFGVFRQILKDSLKEKNNMLSPDDDIFDEEILMDVNDPRNYELIEKMRHIRNRKMRKLLRNDIKFPLWNTPSLRHQLIKLKFTDASLMQKEIPLREEQIAGSPDLMKFLEQKVKEEMEMKVQKDYQKDQPKFKQTLKKLAENFPQCNLTVDRINKTRSVLVQRQNLAKLQKSQGIDTHYPLEQVINETRLLGAHRNIIAFIKQIFAQRRKLRPRKVKQKKVVASAATEATLSIHAIKGMNIPVRGKGHFGSQTIFSMNYSAANVAEIQRANEMIKVKGPVAKEEEDSLIKQERYDYPVTYVQARIVDLNGDELLLNEKIKVSKTNKHTDCFAGVDPEWNETLNLVYQAINKKRGFTIPELLKNDAILYISVFDYIAVDRSRKIGEQAGEITIYSEKRYIGSFSMPLMTLFQNPKINAVFKINRPIFLFGYLSTKSSIFASDSKSGSGDINNPFLPSYINLNLSCEPEFELPSGSNRNYYQGVENSQFLIMCKAWIDQFYEKKSNKSKNIKIWAENIKGQSVFLPRFLNEQGLKPPPSISINESAYQKVARFVSLIPFKNDSQFFKDLPDIYSTCQEFIDLRAGDYEEHAILLCNYFNYLDVKLEKPTIKSYLIFGKAVPEGESVYVLRRDSAKNENEIWNPITGDVYKFEEKLLKNKFFCFTCLAGTRVTTDSLDAICPLKEIHCIVSHENIYINIQKSINPLTLNYKLTDKKKFKPFLSKQAKKKYFKKEIGSIQEPIIYEKTDPQYVLNLQEQIRDYIAMKIEEHRAESEDRLAMATTWVRDKKTREMIDKLLTVLEEFSYTQRSGGLSGEVSPEVLKNAQKEIRKIQKIVQSTLATGKSIYGFPLNMPYADKERIWQEVKNTNIHNFNSERSEYVLGVGIKQYDNYIMSVWVYIAVLHPDKFN